MGKAITMKSKPAKLDMHDLCVRLSRKLGGGWCYNNCRNADGTHSGLYTMDWCPMIGERRFTELMNSGREVPGLTIQLHACVSGDLVVSYFEWNDYRGPGLSMGMKPTISLSRLATRVKGFVLDCIALEMQRRTSSERDDSCGDPDCEDCNAD